jgi:alpha-ketoglutaric semialdehyde dehydrogenase
MTISGDLFIGNERLRAPATFRATNPATGDAVEPGFSVADQSAVEHACALAWSAFDRFRETDAELRARFLEAIGAQIMALGDELLERGNLESGLPIARLTGERARTVSQLRLFAEELRLGGWQGIRVDPALPGRLPLRRSDLPTKSAARSRGRVRRQ